MRLAVTALVFSLAIGCSHAMQTRSNAPQSVERDFIAAFNDLDSTRIGALLEDDATAFLPFDDSASLVTGREAIVAALEPRFASERKRLSSGPPYLHLEARDLRVQEAGDAAVLTFDVGTDRVRSRRTLVVVKRGGAWKIVHLHASNLRPEFKPRPD